MICTILQRRLLALEDPRRPPAELQSHLADCAACREWQRQVVELEERVLLLEVPPSAAMPRLIQRVLTGATEPRRVGAAVRPTLPFRTPGQRRERAIRELALATSLAAGLLIVAFVLGTLNWHRGPGSALPDVALRDPLLANLLQRDLDLAKWPGGDKRLTTLADLAGDLQGETKALAEAGTEKDLEALARCYGQVLEDGIVPLARTLPPEERGRVATRLRQAGATTEQLAAGVADDRGRPLRAMARAANEASRSLHAEARRTQGPGVGFAPGRGVLPASIPLTLLAALDPGKAAVALPSYAEQAGRFRRNRPLIEKLVAGGLTLAQEESPLKRAACCTDLAESVADEMRHAAADRQGARVTELGEHLQKLLKGAVVPNLGNARAHIPSGSAEEPGLQQVKEKTDRFLDYLESELLRTDAVEDVQKTRGEIHAWKDSVARALQRK